MAGAIQQAAEAAVQTAASAPARVEPGQAVKAMLTKYRPAIEKLLAGTGVNEATFIAQIANACRANPDLWDCQPETVLGAALKCAQLGLAPNDPRNLAWIIPYKGNASFQLGYGGVLELARRAVPGLRFDGRPVYPNDDFDLDYGRSGEQLRHRPAAVRGMDRGGDAYLWYVRATFPDGSEQIHALDRAGVDYHRSFSKQPDGMLWTKSFDAAALKSVVVDMRRWLPVSAQMAAGIAADGDAVDVREVEPIEATYDHGTATP